MDFSDLGGQPITNNQAIDFSDLGGQAVTDEPGQLESFGRAVANNIPLAPQAIAGGESLLGQGNYSQNLADWNSKATQAKEAHPITYGAGAVTGAVAPAFIPGVGEFAATIPGGAALGAANAISNEDLTKNPEEVLKNAATGAGTGAALSYGLGKLGEAFSGTKEVPATGPIAVRRGNVDESGSYFSLPGESTYYDPESEGVNSFSLARAKIANTGDEKTTFQILTEALKDPDNSKANIRRIKSALKDPSQGIDYTLNDEVPSIVNAAKKMGYDGIQVWENDDVSKPSSVFLWDTKKAVPVSKAGTITDTVSPAQRLQDKASDISAQGLNLPKKVYGNMTPEQLAAYGNFAQKHDLLNEDTSKALGNVQSAIQQYGKQIQDIGAGSQPHPDITPFALELQTKGDQYAGFNASELKQLGKTYEEAAQDMMRHGENPTFDQLQDMKGAYGKIAFNPDHSVKNPAAADVYSGIKNQMVSMIGAMPEKYQEAMTNYKMALDAEQGLIAKLGAERQGYARKAIGTVGRIIGKLPGQQNPLINLPTAAAVGAMGHPLWGLMAASPTFTNPAVQAGALNAAAKALPTAGKSMNQILNDYLTSKYINKQ